MITDIDEFKPRSLVKEEDDCIDQFEVFMPIELQHLKVMELDGRVHQSKEPVSAVVVFKVEQTSSVICRLKLMAAVKGAEAIERMRVIVKEAALAMQEGEEGVDTVVRNIIQSKKDDQQPIFKCKSSFSTFKSNLNQR